uniref:uncharacterized protein LOC120337206 n=1 Tax=Styela clava TaxID=7725 RepID=UPI00193AA842|nr:uncharacterized protein LOC120337206 [Styela clava]
MPLASNIGTFMTGHCLVNYLLWLPVTLPRGENERFEDTCTDILKRFPTFKHFKVFAQAGTGLALSINEISTIIEDNASSVEDQKFEMLQLWKEKNGSNATSRYIREVVEKHLKAENSGVTGKFTS